MVCASLVQIDEKQIMVSRVKGESPQSHSCMIKCTKTSLTSKIIIFS